MKVNLPWVNALVRIPLGSGGIYRGSIKDISGSEDFFK